MPVALAICGTTLATPELARAQLAITWYTIDGGGGTSAGGSLIVSGTIGQPDAGVLSGGALSVEGGFWNTAITTSCYANCDASTTPPILSAGDFICFLARFRAGDPYANCDGNTSPPTLSAGDFVCFLNAFRAGCP
jgi:hypothetical protein